MTDVQDNETVVNIQVRYIFLAKTIVQGTVYRGRGKWTKEMRA